MIYLMMEDIIEPGAKEQIVIDDSQKQLFSDEVSKDVGSDCCKFQEDSGEEDQEQGTVPMTPAEGSCVSTTPAKSKISHKKWRALIKKQKRKLKRQAEAKQIEENRVEEVSPSREAREQWEKRQEHVKLQYQEKLKEALHLKWLEREEISRQNFEKKKIREKLEKERRLEEERRIREEWEAREKKEKEEQEIKKKRQEELLKEASKNEKKKDQEDDDSWHNPLAPPTYPEVEREPCPFFTKVGACRFGDSCSRGHVYPEISTTILLPGMYTHFKLDHSLKDEYDTDLGLEYEDSDTYQDFKEFYEDTLPEFEKYGRVIQYRVCANYEPHLKGNVYVQYERAEDATRACVGFHCRWYGGRQISCHLTVVETWKQAICGLYYKNRCPKGRNCNFMHAFRNPGNAFWHFDREQQSQRQNTASRSTRKRRSRSRSRTRSPVDRRHYRSYHRHRSRSVSPYDRRRNRSRSPKNRQKYRSRSRERSTRRSSQRYSSRRSRSPNERYSSRRSRSPNERYSSRTKSYRSRKRSRTPKDRSRSRSVSSESSNEKQPGNSGYRSRSISPVQRKKKKSKKFKKNRPLGSDEVDTRSCNSQSADCQGERTDNYPNSNTSNRDNKSSPILNGKSTEVKKTIANTSVRELMQKLPKTDVSDSSIMANIGNKNKALEFLDSVLADLGT